MPLLSEVSGLDQSGIFSGEIVSAGDAVAPLSMFIEDKGGKVEVQSPSSSSAANLMKASATDEAAQEDTTLLQWYGKSFSCSRV